MNAAVKPKRLSLITLLAAGLAAACDSSPSRTGATPRDASTGGRDASTDGDGGVITACTHAPGPAAGNIDILFVVDNSGSMADEQESLVGAFCGLIGAIPEGTDYRIAVVTTDLDSAGDEKAGLQSSTFNPNAPYNFTGLASDACMTLSIAHGCFRGPDPQKRVISSAMSVEEQGAAFAANVRVGSCGSGNERGLAAANVALGRTSPGACNEGFIRTDAKLLVIIVSDEEDADMMSVAALVNELTIIKPAAQLRVAAIVGSAGGDASDCRVPENSTCGQTVCANPPPQGSHTPCDPAGSACPTMGERCLRTSLGNPMYWCENSELEFFTPDFCGWCNFFNAPDCCSALAGGRYVDFVRRVETAVNQAAPQIPVTQCRPQAGQNAACVIESICQSDFAPALARIAEALIAR